MPLLSTRGAGSAKGFGLTAGESWDGTVDYLVIAGGGAGGLSYDYAALTFLRKIQNQKAFEFNLPLSLAPNIIEALKLIMKDNPKFFKKHCTTNISVE